MHNDIEDVRTTHAEKGNCPRGNNIAGPHGQIHKFSKSVQDGFWGALDLYYFFSNTFPYVVLSSAYSVHTT